MNIFDVLIILILLVFVLRGIFKGFISELFEILILIAGIWGGLKYGTLFVYKHIGLKNPVVCKILGVVLFFLILLIVGFILKKVLKDVIEALHLGGVDKFLGALLGFVKGYLFSMAVVILFVNFYPDGEYYIEKNTSVVKFVYHSVKFFRLNISRFLSK